MEMILVLVFLSFCVASSLLCVTLKKKNKALVELHGWLNQQATTLDDFKHRKELLEDHTDDYINSIGESGIRALYDTQALISRVEEMLLVANTTLARGDTDAVAAFVRFHDDNDDSTLGFCPELAAFMDLRKWPLQLERNIQAIGGEIAVASEKFHALGVERRTRKQTSMSLKEARIRLVRETSESKSE